MRLIVAVVVLLQVFGLAAAQGQYQGSQGALCAMEAQARSSEAELAKAVQAETNPIRKQELANQLGALGQKNLLARISFFGGKWGVIGGGIVNIQGAAQFANIFGRITKFEALGGNQFSLNILLDCDQVNIVFGTLVEMPDRILGEMAGRTDLPVVATSLSQLAVGDPVVIIGKLYLSGVTPLISPAFDSNRTYYGVRILGIRKR